MKLLSFHPFSLYGNGGGSRILRRLYQGRESQVIALAVLGVRTPAKKGAITETIVEAMPATQWWMKWYLRKWAIWLRANTFVPFTKRQLQKAAEGISYDVLHVVSHDIFSTALCGKLKPEQKLWVSFHDHFSTTGTPVDDCRQLWDQADRRLVISAEMGLEYQRVFGKKPYEIITDGVSVSEISTPATTITAPVTIYFAGLLHLHYMPLFSILADALDELTAEGQHFKLILRGTQELKFLSNRAFETEYRPLTLNNTELKDELDAAAILYLPIKFTTPDFYLYSLSTKMVGYLGAPGTILYHGPADSAACNLLQTTTSAVCCGSLDVAELKANIKTALQPDNSLSENAKALAKSRFDLDAIQSQFWQDK